MNMLFEDPCVKKLGLKKPDSDAAAVLLVLPGHHHPVRGVAVHTVLHHRVQLLA
jgi:hypothetical protein